MAFLEHKGKKTRVNPNGQGLEIRVKKGEIIVNSTLYDEDENYQKSVNELLKQIL